LETPSNRKALVEAILDLKLPGIDWEEAKKEIEDSHGEVATDSIDPPSE